MPQKIEKNDPFNRKNGIKKNVENSLISNGTRFSQPEYHISMWKTVAGSLKIREKNMKNANKKCTYENFEKQKCISFSYSKDHSIQKLYSLVKRCAL